MTLFLEGPLADRTRWQPELCSIAMTMEIIGSRSAMLLLREAFYGTTRFDDFATRVGITDAVTSARLKQLVDAGILEKHPYREPGARTRHEYLLTEKGRDLLPAVLALMQWGDKYRQRDGGPLDLVDRATGGPVTVQPRNAAGDPLTADDLALRVNQDWLAATPDP